LVLVPLDRAEKAGRSLRVAWPKDQVKDAPRYDKEELGSVAGTERVRISASMDRGARAHYGLEVPVGAGSARARGRRPSAGALEYHAFGMVD